MFYLKKHINFLKKNLLVFLLLGLFSTIHAQQIDINRIEEMPNLPSPYEMRDWKSVAVGYDSIAFDFDRTGQYLPLIWWNPDPVNYPEHESFGLETVVGTPRYHAGEAINILPAVISASLVGIDKSDQNGYNWALMCEEYFNRRPEENIYLNNPVGQSGNDWWYDTMPNVFFYQLYDLYPNTGDFDFQFTSVADQFLRSVDEMGGETTPWHKAYMNYRGWSFSTMEPNASGVREPESAGAIAWILYNAYVETGEERYRIGAEWALEFLDDWNTNPCYEIQMPYGVYTAARMNAELGTQYDVEKFVNWCFTLTSLRSWGVMAETWGGYDVHGLVGELSSNDYAFMMNGYEHAGALVPMTRYDDRFSRAIAKWVLNLANASRLFYPNYLPAENQDSEEWAFEYDPNSYIGHEAIREEINGQSPYATGDAISGGWGNTNLVLYGSSHVGILGGIVETTSEPGILKLDLLKTDYFGDDAYPTYLFYNPYDESKTISEVIGEGSFDIYDVVSNTFIAQGVPDITLITLEPDLAYQLVYIPAGGTVSYDLEKTLVNGIVIDYRNGQTVSNYPPRIKSLAADPNPIVRNQETTLYCSAEDRESEELSYFWLSEDAAISGTGEEVTWTAPASSGEYIVSCRVEDADGESDYMEVTINVLESLPPVINEIVAEPSIVETGGESSITCDASDPEGEDLIYNWSAETGTINGNGETVNWTAPDEVGLYNIRCRVEDENGLEDSDSVAVVAGRMVAYLPFSGNAQDVSGFENHGLVNGAELSYDQSAIPNSAYAFDGVHDNIQIRSNLSLNFTEEMTVNLWMKIEEHRDNETFVISHGSWENRWKVSIIPSRHLRWTVKNDPSTGSNVVDLDSQNPMTAGVWYNIAVTYGLGTVKIYLNGEEDNSRDWTGKINPSDIDLVIGQMRPGNTEYNFPGSVDEVRIYNKVLTAEEILDIYENSSDVFQQGEALPTTFRISDLYPNPFNASTTIKYELPFDTNLKIQIYNLNGQLIKTLADGHKTAGYYSLSWQADNVGSGIYFVRMQNGDNTHVRKLVLIK